VACSLCETSETESSGGEDSREGGNTKSEGRGVSGARGYSETINDEGGSSAQSELSDISGNASRLFLMTGGCIFHSSKPSNVADKLIERVLLETSRTDSSDVEDSSARSELSDADGNAS